MTDETVFSARAARDEDTRADALALPAAGDITLIQADAAADRHARFCFIVEASFNEYERRFTDAPDTLKPVAGYVAQTPGTYGADVTPCFLQVMHEMMEKYSAPVFLVR